MVCDEDRWLEWIGEHVVTCYENDDCARRAWDAQGAEIERLTNAIRVARQFLMAGGPESISECDGGAWDAAETLRLALGRPKNS